MAQPTISGYTIAERIGSGGFASVYLATNDETGQETAIKVLHDHASSPDDIRRFERERTTMRALSGHPNIVGVYDDGQTDDGSHYTVLEYVGDGSVRDRIVEGGALHWANVVEIGVQICAALDVAHRSGVLHRDVKPANILLDDNIAKLSDFGIARLIGQSQVTAAQSIIGTLAYTPPEVFHNKPFDGRGDIYQLGISLYEMLLGRAPFTSAAADNKATIIRRILDHPAPPLAQFDVPQPLSDLLDEVLAKDPADRPQTAESFGRRLNEVESLLGRTPTHVGEDTQSLVIETATITDPTATIAGAQREALWPDSAIENTKSVAPPRVSVAPEAPAVEPPIDADVTIAEPRPTNATSILSPSTPAMSLGTPGPAPSFYEEPTPEPETVVTTPVSRPRQRRRWPWVALLAVLIGAGIGGVAIAQLTDDNNAGNDVDTNDPSDVLPDERIPEFVSLLDEAFAEPAGSDGIIFDSTSNSFGLTMVGAFGNGEGVKDQSSVVWTLEPGTIRMREDFAPSRHRLWSIGVIDGEQFLAVGDTDGVGGSNGVAFAGIDADSFTGAGSSGFAGTAKDGLRASVFDVAAESPGFLVGGTRTTDGVGTMGLWKVEGFGSDESPTWTNISVGSGERGVINDIAVTDELAIAVGKETTDGVEAGVILIRRGDNGWSNLIKNYADAEFWAVTITGERIIAVGDVSRGAGRVPFAIITNAEGQGWFHELPIRGDIGVARDIAVVGDGQVIVVGNVGAETDRDGAIWELIPADDLASDKWTTRASPDLQTDKFTELWAIDEFAETVYVFGRTEDGDRRPAGAWTLNLASS